ncbi:deoxynucleotidyltransferase terminal-interacting protein 1 [Python bivittatus]|uniref:Deoxynucleotidyltransferase terminal-interacting protein 1 n=1 Tax=Python bivittatus TaxID=176946 RepID=A0A9F2REJ2_PYTBI|nr:deoxynucleotidyltransferase terminal-interacting protein 1 [Python bivittatus]
MRRFQSFLQNAGTAFQAGASKGGCAAVLPVPREQQQQQQQPRRDTRTPRRTQGRATETTRGPAAKCSQDAAVHPSFKRGTGFVLGVTEPPDSERAVPLLKFFQKAAGNVRENVGEDVDTEQLIQETCRSCLEQAKLLFCDGKRPVARVPHEVPAVKRARPLEDEVSQQGSPIPRKRKGRPPGQSQPGDRGALGVSTGKTKSCEPVQRDGPKWDPLRLTETTSFVLGSRANKALGMGGTRGRLYIKHPHLFKYAADPQDKHWLAQEQYMRATGGKMAYLLLEEDIQDLAASDEYRSSQDLKLDELKPFTIPSWMIVKMQRYMKTLRSEGEQQLSQQPPPALPEGTRET